MTQQPNPVVDLIADGAELDRMLADLEPSAWALATPAPGWTIAHQIAHLITIFRLAGLAAANPDEFNAVAARLSSDFTANVEKAMAEFLAEEPATLLARWRAQRSITEEALGAVAPDHIVPWLVRALPASVLTAAGMMELFGHGQDIADALGIVPQRTDRIGHVAAFAVRTWDFGYQARGMATPEVEFRFELTAPSGKVWTFGPATAVQTITGPAEDFCLLVTRRRHRDDLALRAQGDDADQWLSIAQAYRGPAGPGRTPGQFAASSR